MNIFSGRRSSSATRTSSRSRSMSGSFRRGSRARSLSLGGDSIVGRDRDVAVENQEPLECNLNLSGNKLSLSQDGEWVYETQANHELETELNRLRTMVKQLEDGIDKRDEQVLQLSEQNNLLGFQNRILTELLAVAQLDAEKNNEEWQKEELKTQALKFELATTNIEIYRRRKADIDRNRRDSVQAR